MLILLMITRAHQPIDGHTFSLQQAPPQCRRRDDGHLRFYALMPSRVPPRLSAVPQGPFEMSFIYFAAALRAGRAFSPLRGLRHAQLRH